MIQIGEETYLLHSTLEAGMPGPDLLQKTAGGESALEEPKGGRVCLVRMRLPLVTPAPSGAVDAAF